MDEKREVHSARWHATKVASKFMDARSAIEWHLNGVQPGLTQDVIDELALRALTEQSQERYDGSV